MSPPDFPSSSSSVCTVRSVRIFSSWIRETTLNIKERITERELCQSTRRQQQQQQQSVSSFLLSLSSSLLRLAHSRIFEESCMHVPLSQFSIIRHGKGSLAFQCHCCCCCCCCCCCNGSSKYSWRFFFFFFLFFFSSEKIIPSIRRR